MADRRKEALSWRHTEEQLNWKEARSQRGTDHPSEGETLLAGWVGPRYNSAELAWKTLPWSVDGPCV